eukprot:g1303.t1
MSGGPEAFTFAVISHDLPDRIDCVSPWHDRLLVGLADGSLVILEPEFGLDVVGPWSIQDHIKGVGKRGFIQIEVISSVPGVLTLSSGVLALHSLPGVSLISHVAVSGSPYRFAWTDEESLLCVAVRKNLVFFTLQNTRFIEKTTVVIPDAVKTMAWCGNVVCYGTRAKYVFVDPSTNQITESIPMGRSVHPILTPLPNDEILLGKDSSGMYVKSDGRLARGVFVNWSATPLAVVLCQPFVVGLFPNFIEVRNVSPTARQCVIQMFNDIDNVTMASSTVGIDRSVFMASRDRRTVCRLNPVPLRQQIEMLIEMKEFQDALQVVELLNEDDRVASEDDIRVSYGVHLFSNQEYNEGLMQFTMRSQRSPLLLLKMFPSLLPENMFENFTLPVSEKYFEGFQEPEGEDYIQAVSSLLPLLLADRTRLASRRRDDVELDQEESKKQVSLKSINESDEEAESSLGDSTRSYYEVDGVGRTLSASKMLSRVKRNNLSVLVDTAIMKAMLVVPDSGALLQFVRGHNSIDLVEGENSLTQAGKYLELAYLFQSHGNHEVGMEILRKLSLEPEKLEVLPTGASSNLQGLTGVWAAVHYLSKLKEEDASVIRKHAKWVIEQDPDAALEVFVGSENRLPPSLVLPILHENAPQFSALYLEAMLDKGDASREEYDSVLVGIYLQEALGNEKKLGPIHLLIPDDEEMYDFDLLNKQSSEKLSEKDALISGHSRINLSEIDNKPTMPSFVSPTPVESYIRLRQLLINSTNIDPTEVLGTIPYDSLLELQALLLERKQNHRSALRVYIQRLEDLTLAEALCDRVYQQAKSSSVKSGVQSFQTYDVSEQTDNLYMDMIRIYLEPQQAGVGEIRHLSNEEWRSLGVLLCRKRYRINIEEMFELLPGDVELSVLMTFIEGALRTLSEQQRNLSIIHNLYSCENMLHKEQLMRCHQQSVTVTYESACVICHKRIGNAVFVAYPNGSLAHISCYTRESKTDPAMQRISSRGVSRASSSVSRNWL